MYQGTSTGSVGVRLVRLSLLDNMSIIGTSCRCKYINQKQ